jgi:hypothetical protein
MATAVYSLYDAVIHGCSTGLRVWRCMSSLSVIHLNIEGILFWIFSSLAGQSIAGFKSGYVQLRPSTSLRTKGMLCTASVCGCVAAIVPFQGR